MDLYAIIGSVNSPTTTTAVAAIIRSIRSEQECACTFLEDITLIARTRGIEERYRLVRLYSLICNDTVISSHP
jgi:uncharacterized protein YerC